MLARWTQTGECSGYPDAVVLTVLHVPGPQSVSLLPSAAFYLTIPRMTRLEMVAQMPQVVQGVALGVALAEVVVETVVVVAGLEEGEETADGRIEDDAQRPRATGLSALCTRRSWLL